MIDKVKNLVGRISMSCFGTQFTLRVEHDLQFSNGRIFLQIRYNAPCTKTGDDLIWYGRKWYLSEHMTDDEVIKTAFAAFDSAVKHEVLEGFKVDNIILFNPHVNFESLLTISDNEIKRA